MAKVSPRFPMQFAQNFRLAYCPPLTLCAISFSTRTTVGNFSSLMRSYAIPAKTFLTFCVNFGQFSSPRWLTTVEIAAISPPHRFVCSSTRVPPFCQCFSYSHYSHSPAHCRHVVLWFGLSLFRVFCQISSAPRFILSFRAFRLCKAFP